VRRGGVIDRRLILCNRSDADDPVVLLDQPRQVGRRDPAAAEPGQVLVGRPTGDRAALSDVDRDLVVEQLPEEVARGRDTDALNAVGGLSRDELGRVAREHDGALLTYLDGAVRRNVEW